MVAHPARGMARDKKHLHMQHFRSAFWLRGALSKLHTVPVYAKVQQTCLGTNAVKNIWHQWLACTYVVDTIFENVWLEPPVMCLADGPQWVFIDSNLSPKISPF